MDDIKCFTIEGKKNILFRQEGNEYVFFDPIALEYYVTNYIGAEILYYISKGKDFKFIVDKISEEYDITEDMGKETIKEFLLDFPLLSIISSNLIESDIYKEISA
ncbi:PqqD family peptide maturation chaperone WgkC [Bacillus cytotoxicus]|uniref:PqqD family peptide maturation chaperone WgkC n=1 Tax=Bacillus cytotoxicus TaxID=580165 RepID=UPI003D7EACCB